jgi:hypothetical protein
MIAFDCPNLCPECPVRAEEPAFMTEVERVIVGMPTLGFSSVELAFADNTGQIGTRFRTELDNFRNGTVNQVFEACERPTPVRTGSFRVRKAIACTAILHLKI